MKTNKNQKTIIFTATHLWFRLNFTEDKIVRKKGFHYENNEELKPDEMALLYLNTPETYENDNDNYNNNNNNNNNNNDNNNNNNNNNDHNDNNDEQQ